MAVPPTGAGLMTMSSQNDIVRNMRQRGFSDDQIQSEMQRYALDPMALRPTSGAAGIGDDVDDFGIGDRLWYGTRKALGMPIEGIGQRTGLEFLEQLGEDIGPSEEQEQARNRDALEKARQLEAGEITESGAFAGDVADAIVESAPQLGGGMAAAATGAAIGSVVPVVGTAIGAAVGAAAYGISSMYGEAYEKAEAHGLDTSDPEVRKRIDMAAIGGGALDAITPFKILRVLKPGKAAEIAAKGLEKSKLGKRAAKEGAENFAAEGLTEVGQEALQAILLDPEAYAKLDEGQRKELMPYLTEEYGRDFAIAFFAGAGLGGGAGAVSGASAQMAQNAEVDKRAAIAGKVAEQRGVDPELVKVENLSAEEKADLAADVQALRTAESNLRVATATLEQDPENEQLQAAVERNTKAWDKAADTFASKRGGQTKIEAEKKAKTIEESRAGELKDRAKQLGLSISKDNDLSFEEQTSLVERLQEATEKRNEQKIKVARQKSRGKRKEQLDKLQKADEALAEVRAEAAQKLEGADPDKVRSDALKQAQFERRAADEAPVQEFQRNRIQEQAAALGADLNEYTQKIIDDAGKKVKGKKKREINAEIEALEKRLDTVTSDAELSSVQGQLDAKRAELSGETPRVTMARRLREENGFDAQQEPDTEAAAPSPSGQEPSTEATEPQTPKAEAKTAGGASAGVAPDVGATPAVATPADPDITNVRQERISDYERARSEKDTVARDIAVEAILGDAGIAVTPETKKAFTKGTGKVQTRLNRAAKQDPNWGAPVEAAPEPVAASTDAAPANDPRRAGGNISKQHRWKTLLDDVDPDAGMEAHEDFLRNWTTENGFEASATYDAEGNLLGIGTNRHTNEIAMPSNGWGQAGVTMTHTHPQNTPMSSADVMILAVMDPETGVVRAVLPNGQTTEIRRTDAPLTREIVTEQFHKLRDALDEVIPSGLGLTAAARIKQEAFLRHLDQEGLILYSQPMSGFSAAEENTIYGAIDRAASDQGIRDDVGDGTPASAGGPDSTAGAAVAPEGAGEAAAGLDVSTIAPVAEAGSINDAKADEIIDPIVSAAKALPNTNNATDLDKAILTGKTKVKGKTINVGKIGPAAMKRALGYAVNSINGEPSEASTVVLQTARLLFPKAELTPSTIVKSTVMDEKGFLKRPELDDAWQKRMNVAYQFLNRVGQEQGLGFRKTKLPFKRSNGFWDGEATHFESNPKLERFLELVPDEAKTFKEPMEDPTDTGDMVRHPDTNRFSDEAIDRMRGSAEMMQANTYYIDQEALDALTEEDLISGKKLAEAGLKREGDVDLGAPIVSKDGAPQLSERQEKFMRQQTFKARKKLAMLRRMAKDHEGKPIGYTYQIDDKGRIYADGVFTPQTGDAFKSVLRVGAPDGVRLKDMPMIDHSASGMQMATLMTRDKEAAGWFNLGRQLIDKAALALTPGYKKRDMYQTLMDDLRVEVEAEAAAGNEQAQQFKEAVLDKNKGFGKPEIKPAVIAVNYAGSEGNFVGRFEAVYKNDLRDHGLDGTQINAVLRYMGNRGYNQMKRRAPKMMEFQEWAIKALTKLIDGVEGDANALKDRPQLEFSVGLDGLYAALKPKVHEGISVAARDGQAEEHVRVQQEIDVPTRKVDPKGTARSIYSQIIQGFDAAVLHRALEIFAENNPGEFVTTNHDSYTTPQGKAGAMAAASRQAMKEIFEEVGDPVGRLRQEIEAQAEKFGVKVPNVNDPNLFNEDGSFKAGDFQLSELDTSVPTFVENAKDAPPAYTNLKGELMTGAPEDFPDIARGIDYEASDTGETTGVRMDTSLPKAAQFAQDNQFANQRQFKSAIQERALAAQAEEGIDLRENSEENVDRLADFAVEDAKAALVDNQNAVGWYDTKVTAAKNILAERHPEILTEPEAELRFIWALAVTSNGLKVDKNFELAEQAYVRSKNSRKFPTDIGVGEAAKSINNGLGVFNKMSETLSTDELISFMTGRQPVRDINKKMVELGIKNDKGKPLTVSGEQMSTVLPGAVILGPKIGGGFFSNLYGNFDELTMDRWFMRSVGRWRGDLITDRAPQIKAGQGRIKDAIRSLSPEALKQIRAMTGVPARKTMTKDQMNMLAVDIAKRSQKPAWRTAINNVDGGSEVRLAGNSLAKNLDSQKEQPAGATERTFLRKVFSQALERLQSDPDMSDLTMSDLQALLWYPEKTLYDTMKKSEGDEAKGYTDEDAPDYENAARKLISGGLGQAGQAGRGDGVGSGERAAGGARSAASPSPIAQGIDVALGRETYPNSWLSEAGVSEITVPQAQELINSAASLSGVEVEQVAVAEGGWADPAQPSGVSTEPSTVVSLSNTTPEGLRKFAAVLGSMAGQHSVMVATTDTTAPNSAVIKIRTDAPAGEVFSAVNAVDPDALGGFSATEDGLTLMVMGEQSPDLMQRMMEAIGEYDAEVEVEAADAGFVGADTDSTAESGQGYTASLGNVGVGPAAAEALLGDARRSASSILGIDGPDGGGGGSSTPIAAGIDWSSVRQPDKIRGIASPAKGKTVLQQVATQLDPNDQPLLDNVVKWLGKTKRKLARGIFKEQAGLNQIETLAGYDGATVHQGMSRMAQLMSNTTGRIAAMMQYGAPKWDPVKQTMGYAKGTKGLADIFEFQDTADYNKFQGYAYAKRDREVMARGKSPRMTDDLRAEYESIPDADKKRYDDMLADYGKFNQAMRDLMLDTGLISKEEHTALTADKDYVPLGRVFKNTDEFGLDNFFGTQGGFNHPDPDIHSLSDDVAKIGEPGADAEFGDLIDAIQKSAAGTLVAAQQNIAHRRIHDFMSGNLGNDISKLKGIAEVKNLKGKQKKAAFNDLEQDAVTFRKDGKKYAWKLKGDPEWTGAIQMALTGLKPVELDAFDRIMSGFNSFQRDVITGIPSFAAASVMRDAGQAFVQSGVNPANVVTENIKQMKQVISGASEETRNLMMAAGVGGYQMQGMPDQDAASFRKRVRAQESGMLDIARRGMNEWQRLMGATEIAGRKAVADKVKAKGQSEADQAFEALNLIDFGQKGGFKAVQRLNRMVLFLNPRLQGLYRLSQPTAGETPRQHHTRIVKKVFARGAMITGVSMALRALIAASEEDEEKYEKLTQQEKAGYWHLPTFGMTEKMIRIPKPFEVGALFGTLPVQLADSILKEDQSMNEFGQALRFAGMETFSLNPMPAIAKPMAEIALNRNMFTGREIEGMSQQGRAKEYRTDERTGFLASKAGNKALSPVQLQHLAQGYLGPLGMLAYNAADATAAALAGTEPEKFRSNQALKKSAQQVAGVGGGSRFLSKTEEEALQQQGREYYEMRTLMDGYATSIKDLRKAGDYEEAEELVEKHERLLSQRSYFKKVNKALLKLNKFKKETLSNPDLTAEERLERMRTFHKKRNELTSKAVERARKAGVRAGFAGGFFLGAAA